MIENIENQAVEVLLFAAKAPQNDRKAPQRSTANLINEEKSAAETVIYEVQKPPAFAWLGEVNWWRFFAMQFVPIGFGIWLISVGIFALPAAIEIATELLGAALGMLGKIFFCICLGALLVYLIIQLYQNIQTNPKAPHYPTSTDHSTSNYEQQIINIHIQNR